MEKLETIHHLNTGASVSSYTNKDGEDLSVFESPVENVEIPIKSIKKASNKLLETVIALNQGRLILPGKHSTLLLEKLAYNEAQISYGGYKYKFFKHKKKPFAAIRLADGLEGEFKVGIQNDAFFVPFKINTKAQVTVNLLTRYYTLNKDLAKAEYNILKDQDYLLSHHFNIVSNSDFRGVLEGHMEPTKYLNKFSKLSKIKSKDADIPLYIARLTYVADLFKNGKTIARPVLERRKRFTKAEQQFVAMAVKENFVGDRTFKMMELGKYTFEEYLKEGSNYLYSSAPISRIKIREITRGIIDIVCNPNLESNKKPISIGLYPSTISDALGRELRHLFKDLPIDVKVINTEKRALSDTYMLDNGEFPNSPLNELKSRLVHENVSKTWIKIKLAQEAAFQILKAKNSRLVCEITKSDYPEIEKNYQAALIANKMSFWDCEDMYNAFREGLY